MKKKIDIKSLIKDAILLLMGCAFYSAAISFFLEPNNLVSGGVTGISIVINYFTAFPVGVMTFLINVPLFIIGVIKFKFKFLFSTIISVALVSTFIDIFAFFPAPTDDKLLASVAGGFLMALGIGLLFKVGATTGGTDIIVKLLKLKYKHIKTGELFLVTDMITVSISAILFKDFNVILYAAIMIALQTITLDVVLYGRDEAKLVYIISDNYKEIADIIMIKKEFGVTFLKGVGAYTGTNKEVIMCVVKKQNLTALREIVTATDTKAFMIITSATAVFGEGFKPHESEEL